MGPASQRLPLILQELFRSPGVQHFLRRGLLQSNSCRCTTYETRMGHDRQSIRGARHKLYEIIDWGWAPGDL